MNLPLVINVLVFVAPCCCWRKPATSNGAGEKVLVGPVVGVVFGPACSWCTAPTTRC